MNGTVECWGSNDYGRASPPPIIAAIPQTHAAGTDGQCVTISVGATGMCCLGHDGGPSCWGVDDTLFTRVTAVAVGTQHVCGVTASGVQCVGDDASGQASPPSLVANISSIAAGDVHSCALLHNGSCSCWGSDAQNRTSPPEDAFLSISAREATCGVTTSRELRCWGPSLGDVPLGAFSRVRVGVGFACALRDNGSLACFGVRNEFGQASPPAGRFLALDVAARHACAVAEDGSVTCWGDNSGGQLDVAPGLGVARDVGVGDKFSVAVLANYECNVQVWGLFPNGLSCRHALLSPYRAERAMVHVSASLFSPGCSVSRRECSSLAEALSVFTDAYTVFELWDAEVLLEQSLEVRSPLVRVVGRGSGASVHVVRVGRG
ncbi:MAG: hypothetical protein HYZ27_09895 [Deltaproteobacteria bacterium]|nr:hypothetical protein [Deltaproteobacteria bacterium]